MMDNEMYRPLRPFRFWCQKVLPAIYDDSLSYYELLAKVIKTLNESIETENKLVEAFQELQEYVVHYLDSVDFEQIVDDKIEQMLADGEFDELFEETLAPKINELIEVYKNIPSLVPPMNVVKTVFRNKTGDSTVYVNGACYLNNGRCVVAYSSAVSVNTTLVVYDIDTWNVVNEYTLPLKHANTITYNPLNNKLYVCGFADYRTPTTLIPDIYVVDGSSFTLDQTIIPPLPEFATGIHSLIYDKVKDVFYATFTTAGNYGEYNTVITYNNTLTEIVNRQILDKWTLSGTQGIAYANNGVIYVIWGSLYHYAITGFDLSDGSIVKTWNLKPIVNGYRKLCEAESLIYDERNGDFYLTSRYYNAGVRNKEASSIFKIGLFKPLIEFVLLPNQYGWNDVGRITTYVYNGDSTVLTANAESFNCIGDVITAGVENNLYFQVGFANVGDGIDDIDIVDFNGTISGSYEQRLTIRRVRVIGGNVRFNYCDFIGSETSQDTGATCSMSFAKTTLGFGATTTENGISGIDSTLYNVATLQLNVQRCIVISNTDTPETGSVLTQSVYLKQYS